MKIKSIYLNNFRQYRDFKIEFDIDDESKNVTVIRARNSTGKTTLTQAIIWCLYGEEEIDLDLTEKLINNVEREEAATNDQDELEYFVELEIYDRGQIVYLLRKQTLNAKTLRKKLEEVEYTYVENGETFHNKANNKEPEKMSIINKKINTLLSKEIANNFLFDGERIEKIASKSRKSRNEISNAITSISQLPTLEISLNNLKVLENRLRNEDVEIIDDQDLKDINEQIDFARRTGEQINELIESEKKELLETEERFNEIENELSNYSDISKQQEKRIKLDEDKRSLENEIESIRKDIYSKYVQYNHRKYVYLLYKKYETIDIFDAESTNTIPHVTEDSISYLIDRRTCICGTEINHQMEENLNEQKKYQPPQSNESLLSTYKSDIEKESGHIDDLVVDLKKLITNYHKKANDKEDIEQELVSINKTITNSNEETVRNLNTERKTLTSKKIDLGISIRKLEQQSVDNLDEQEDLRNKYQEMKSKKSNSDFMLIRSEILEEAIKKLQNYSQSSKSKLREEIEKVANKHFTDIITKDKKIQISEDFMHKVIDKNGDEAATSSGELIAVSVSIILAIIETHKDNILNSKNVIEEQILHDREFFLVMDGPFAVLDQHFAKDISLKLSNSVEQMILLTNDNQYNDSVKGSLAPKLSKEYILEAPEGEGENIYTKYLVVTE